MVICPHRMKKRSPGYRIMEKYLSVIFSASITILRVPMPGHHGGTLLHDALAHRSIDAILVKGNLFPADGRKQSLGISTCKSIFQRAMDGASKGN